ncbi:MAG: monovalent cation/H+ antiporter subunit D family protein [Euryarchaeota archaeon]|nr:monovalent cation/H+ antiporter subunit D family protein [Euryarchaeota archaeon]
MEVIESARPLMAVLVSLGAVPLILASKRNPNVREAWTIIAAVLKFAIVASMLPIVLSGNVVEYTLYQFSPALLPGLELKFRADAFGMFFATIASFLWILTSLYSIGYMRSLKEHAQTRYFMCFAVSLSATMGIAFAANLLTLFIFYEILSIITYPLVIHEESREAVWAGKKYLVYLVGGSIGFQMTAMIIIYALTGTLDFSNSGIIAGHGMDKVLVALLLFMLVFGYTKAGVMPLHSWLPTAMIAPTPVSALLHAVAVVKAGVFSVLRVVFFVFGPDLLSSLDLGTMLGYVASFTIIMASVFALTRDNLKQRLAYSTVSQLSYVILGAALLTPSGMVGGTLHILSHAFGKITLFFCAGAIFVATQKKNISEMAGIGWKMPITMTAFSIGALSMIGMPPAVGFLSKWYMALGTIQEPTRLVFLAVLLASAILNAGYFFPVIYTAFFKPLPEGEEPGFKEAPMFCVVPLSITAIGTIVFLFYPGVFLELARMAVEALGGP